MTWLQSLLKKLGGQNRANFQFCGVIIKELGLLASNPVFHARIKHIEIDAAAVPEIFFQRVT